MRIHKYHKKMSRTKSTPIKKVPVWNFETPPTRYIVINDIELKNIRKKMKFDLTQVEMKLEEIIRPYNDYVMMILDGEIDPDLPRPLLTAKDILIEYPKMEGPINERIMEMKEYLTRFFMETIIPGILIKYGEGKKMTENVARDICIYFIEHEKNVFPDK